MKISKLARREAKALFRSCFVDGVLDNGRVRLTVNKLAAEKPRGYLALLTHFHRLVKLEVDRRTARVESAEPLSADLQSDLKNRLSALYGAGLSVSFDRNPALLGGLRIKVGSDVYDSSIRSRLEALEQNF